MQDPATGSLAAKDMIWIGQTTGLLIPRHAVLSSAYQALAGLSDLLAG